LGFVHAVDVAEFFRDEFVQVVYVFGQDFGDDVQSTRKDGDVAYAFECFYFFDDFVFRVSSNRNALIWLCANGISRKRSDGE